VLDIVPMRDYSIGKKFQGVILVKFITTQQAADFWGVSDRQVRKLCSEGKILGAVKEGKMYRIPADAEKPVDGRLKKADRYVRYLKWGDDIIGNIESSNAVEFTAAEYNEVVTLYTRGAPSWTPEQFNEFLSERIVSRDRRDIERILFRCGLLNYDTMQIAEITRGVHPKDLLWIAHSVSEKFEDAITAVFDSVFHHRTDLAGDSIDTPEGYNIKRYGVYEGNYGIYKQRISPLVTDVESEVAVYMLAKKLGVPCCPAYRTGKDTVFSEFRYDFSKEYIVHFRRLFDAARSDNEYANLVSVRPQYRDDIARMILLDFITRQDDRHLSNIAIKVSAGGESFYPLYDNGRSLFYEDTEEMARQAADDPEKHATTFGYSGTYWDYVKEIATERADIKALLNLDITRTEVADILKNSGFTGYRFDGALEWIVKTVDMIRAL
jgi:excisionase family DNA binding protein